MPLVFDQQRSVLEKPKREDVPADFMAELDETVDAQIEKQGFALPFYYVLPLNPEAFRGMEYFSKHFLRCESYLSFLEKEIIAVVVSSINSCAGCLTGHTARIRSITGNNMLAEQLGFNYRTAMDLTERQRIICDYAYELTVNISTIDSESWANKLRAAGLDDHQILEAALVSAYYNFSNRYSMGLGIKSARAEYER